MILTFSGASVSSGQRNPQDVPVPGSAPTNDQVPGGPNDPPRIPEPPRDYFSPGGDSNPGRVPGPDTPAGDFPQPPPPMPDEPASGGDIPGPGGPDISDLPPLPDDPSVIQPELETEYLTAPVFKDAAPQTIADAASYVPDQVIVLLRGVSGKGPQIEGLGNRYNLEQLGNAALASLDVTMIVFEIPDGRSVPAVVNILSADNEVLLSQPNFYYGSLSGENPQYGAAKIGAEAAHKTTTGRGIIIAVVDTGVDFNHPGLKDKIALKSDFVSPDMTGFTGESHGTSVAGIIAASAVEEGGMAGIAPDVRIIAARACWSDPGNGKKAVCSSDKLAKAIDFAISNNARIINLSVGGPKDGLISALVQTAYGSGITIVAAAGNGGAKGKPVYPAALPQVIAVSATDSEDSLYVLSTRGDYVDVAAPGVDILSPAPGNSWRIESGTSMAAAHVSGAIALILQNYPELSPFQIKYLMGSSAVDLGKAGKDPEFGEGRIDVSKALDKLDLSSGEASVR